MQPMTMSTCARARAGGGETLEGENVCAPSPTCNDRRTPLCAPCHTPATGRCSLCTPLSPQCPKNVRSCSAVQRWRPRATSPPCSPCPNHEASRRARPRRPARVRPPYAPARRLNQTNRRTAMMHEQIPNLHHNLSALWPASSGRVGLLRAVLLELPLPHLDEPLRELRHGRGRVPPQLANDDSDVRLLEKRARARHRGESLQQREDRALVAALRRCAQPLFDPEHVRLAEVKGGRHTLESRFALASPPVDHAGHVGDARLTHRARPCSPLALAARVSPLAGLGEREERRLASSGRGRRLSDRALGAWRRRHLLDPG
mmetsp:Transcript_6266/g.21022  ORF Transcript_6266/g.21022 Transcript_6266/m.21022 type:complete len:317 (-) Transcript_6266:20-970(-)